MHSKSLLIGTLCLAILSLSSCSKHLRHDFGEANLNNIEKQQQYAETPEEDVEHTLDGRKAERVIINYRKEKSQSGNERLINDMSN